MKISKYKDPKKEVSKYMQKVSKLYGFKIPDAGTALDLVNHIIKTFPYIHPTEIEFSFEYVSSQKCDIDINSYGKTLTIPILNKVIRAWRSYKRKLYNKRNNILTKSESRIQNINARITILGELETMSPLRFYHYDLVDSYIYKFSREEKRDAMAYALRSEYRRRQEEDLKLRKERKTFQGMRTDLRATARVIAKVYLVTNYVAQEVINYPAIEELIKVEKPIS